MGWWSTTIMGGDEPYDFASVFADDIFNLKEIDGEAEADQSETDQLIEYNRNQINQTLRKAVEFTNDDECREYGDREIAGQVLGVLIMAYGAKMPDDVRQLILECAKNDEWAHDDEKREHQIFKFMEQIKAYPSEGGQCVYVDQEGLFDVVEKAITEGQTGLINKNV